ncbi:MAG: hypothetical protein AAGF87_11060 [Bacteroidota bacterium]
MKNEIIFFSLLIILSSCVKSGEQKAYNFKIDDTVKETVEASISELEFASSAEDVFLIYNNPLAVDYYENDSLVATSKNEPTEAIFRSFYYYQNDTLVIDGMYGLFGGFGFSIKIVENQAETYHLVAGDDFPAHSLTIDGDLQLRVEVPCIGTKLILSKLPEPNGQEIIYGLVEFESVDYFHRGTIVEGEEVEARSKVRMDMKVYFKSKFLNIESLG